MKDLLLYIARNLVDNPDAVSVTEVEGDEELTLELRVFKHSRDSRRRGKYSVWCHERDCFYNMLFDVDGFDSREQAKEWADYYFEFLGELGIDFKLSEQND